MSNRNGKKSAAPLNFNALLVEVKDRIQSAQMRAVLSANSELVRLYWDIGRIIHERQNCEGWGAAVIPRLARALHNELPEIKGFSERNIKRMLAFYREYANQNAFLSQTPAKRLAIEEMPQSAAQLKSTSKVPQPASLLPDSLFRSLPWFHHVILMEKVKDLSTRRWYMERALANSWSRNVMALQIDARAHTRAGKAVTNFDKLLPVPQSDLARQTLKDPYIFDFLTLTEPFHERELETGLVRHLEKFLLELGQGFAFIGRQYRIVVSEEDFYIDLLFYHIRLRCFIVIELKKGAFKPEYADKLNFYCNIINDRLRHPTDEPTIGLILCQTKNSLVAEYSFAGIDKPIGISTYELTRALPPSLQSALPTVEDIETELAERSKKRANSRKMGSSAKAKGRV